MKDVDNLILIECNEGEGLAYFYHYVLIFFRNILKHKFSDWKWLQKQEFTVQVKCIIYSPARGLNLEGL